MIFGNVWVTLEIRLGSISKYVIWWKGGFGIIKDGGGVYL